jgi:hypothetical protein
MFSFHLRHGSQTMAGIWLVSFMDYDRLHRSGGKNPPAPKQSLWP